jgi:ParB-like chromosome segregation protein Spo0J
MARGKLNQSADLERRLDVVYRPIAELIPYARNARTHSDAQVAQIAASIREFGWTNPILIDGDRGVIAGHGRIAAARELGMAEVPTIELAGLSEAQRRAYIIADNKLAMNAGWDDEMLRLEIGDLQTEGFELGLLGFSLDELAGLEHPSFEPGTEDDQSRLDQKNPTVCPSCGHEF